MSTALPFLVTGIVLVSYDPSFIQNVNNRKKEAPSSKKLNWKDSFQVEKLGCPRKICDEIEKEKLNPMFGNDDVQIEVSVILLTRTVHDRAKQMHHIGIFLKLKNLLGVLEYDREKYMF